MRRHQVQIARREFWGHIGKKRSQRLLLVHRKKKGVKNEIFVMGSWCRGTIGKSYRRPSLLTPRTRVFPLAISCHSPLKNWVVVRAGSDRWNSASSAVEAADSSSLVCFSETINWVDRAGLQGASEAHVATSNTRWWLGVINAFELQTKQATVVRARDESKRTMVFFPLLRRTAGYTVVVSELRSRYEWSKSNAWNERIHITS